MTGSGSRIHDCFIISISLRHPGPGASSQGPVLPCSRLCLSRKGLPRASPPPHSSLKVLLCPGSLLGLPAQAVAPLRLFPERICVAHCFHIMALCDLQFRFSFGDFSSSHSVAAQAGLWAACISEAPGRPFSRHSQSACTWPCAETVQEQVHR